MALGDGGPGKPVDFFISYTSADRRWAEWIGWQLEEAGYHVLIQAWDIVPGTNFVERMDRAIHEAARTIAVLSPEYLTSVYTKLELQAAYRSDPDGLRRRLLPVRVAPCEVEGLLAVIVYIDLVGIDDEAGARRTLLDSVRRSVSGRGKPETKPAFPAARAVATRPLFPGTEPAGVPRDASALTVLHLSEPRFMGGGTDDPLAGLAADAGRLAAETGARPDLLVVTGDLAEGGRPSELARARAFLTGLADRLGLPRERVIVVPGDHDVSRSASLAYFNTCEADELVPAPPYWPKWRHFSRMIDELYRDVRDVVFDSVQPWSLFEIPELHVVVAGLNSTMAESHRPEDHYGWIGEEQARWFAERLVPYREAGWLRVGAVHHNPLAGEAADTLRDAEAADRWLGEHLHLLLHGHDRRDSPAAELASGLALAGCGAAAGAVRRYQLVRVGADGMLRWPRHLDPASGQWAPEAPRRLSRRWRSASSALPEAGAPEPAGGPARQEAAAEPEPAPPWEAHADPDDLLARVAEVCALRHAGSIVKRIGAPDLPHLLVTYQEEGFVRQLRVGALTGSPTPDTVEDYIARVHAIDPEPGSVLVYQGEPPDLELAYRALSRGVRLLSFAEYRGLLDLRGYVARQRRRLAGDGLYPPELYVPQRYRPLDVLNAPVSDDLPEAVLRLLASDQGRFILLLGDFGRGKTFLLRELARRIPDQLPHLTPVLIELRALEKAHTVEELVAQHLASYGEDRIDLAAFRYMLRTGGIALLFDGFDELALRMTYDRAAMHLETLVQAAEGQAKIVATSRTQHFVSHAQALTALGERVGLLPNRRLLEIEDFSEDQIRRFLVNRYGDHGRAEARLETLRSVRDLLGLSRNPRMLWFIADLDEEQLRAAQARTGEICAADLYRQILDRWLTYEVNRLEVAGSPATLDKGQRWDAVTALALRLWQSSEGAIELDDLSEVAATVLADLADLQMTEDQAVHVVGSGTLLTRTGDGRFAFVHASVMEWLVAADVARRFEAGDASPAPLRLRPMSPLMVEFLCDLAQPAACRAWADAALADPDAGDAAKQNALRIAERVRASAWVRADLRGRSLRGADFSEQDLRGADLTDADLTEATLVGTDLTGAALRGARLVGARLDRARLVGADLTGADLTRARLLGADLTGATVTDSAWPRAAVVGVTASDGLLRAPELRGAAIQPRQPVGLELAPVSVGVSHSFERGALVADLVAFSPDGEVVAVGGEDGGVVLCDGQSGLPLRRLSGHTGRVWSLAFAGHGRLLVTTGADRTVRLWDPTSGRQLDTISRAGAVLWPAAMAPNGLVLATGGGDGAVQTWAADAGRELRTLTGHEGWVWSMTFSRDSALLATGGSDGRVHLWDAVAGQPRHRLADAGAPVWSVAFSPDGRTVAAGADDGSLRLWDTETGALLGHHAAHTGPVWTVAFDPDGRRLVTAGADHLVLLRDAAGGWPLRTLAGHTDEVWAAVFSSDGALLATAGNDHGIRLWDAAGEHVHTLAGHAGPVWSLAFRPDGGLLASTGNDDTVRLWDVERGRPHHTLAGHGTRIWAVAFSPDGDLLASSGSDAVRLWNPATGKPRRLRVEAPQHRMLAISPDGGLIATTANDGTVRLWDTGTGLLHHAVSARTDWIWALAFSADGRLLATANDDDTVRLWDTATGREHGELAGHRGRVRSIAFEPAGMLVATACDDRTARLWDRATGAHVRTLTGHTDRVYAVAFQPSGALLATGSSDGSARLWSTVTGDDVRVLSGHTDHVWHIAFSPDGRLLATAGADHTVRIWDVARRSRLHLLSGHTDQVWSVAFSPDGRLLASASSDGTVRIWDVRERPPALRAILLGLPDGWAALAEDGRYKVEGDPAGRFWYVIGQCRFEAGELDPYLPAIRRLGEEEVF